MGVLNDFIYSIMFLQKHIDLEQGDCRARRT